MLKVKLWRGRKVLGGIRAIVNTRFWSVQIATRDHVSLGVEGERKVGSEGSASG